MYNAILQPEPEPVRKDQKPYGVHHLQLVDRTWKLLRKCYSFYLWLPSKFSLVSVSSFSCVLPVTFVGIVLLVTVLIIEAVVRYDRLAKGEK